MQLVKRDKKEVQSSKKAANIIFNFSLGRFVHGFQSIKQTKYFAFNGHKNDFLVNSIYFYMWKKFAGFVAHTCSHMVSVSAKIMNDFELVKNVLKVCFICSNLRKSF